MLMAISYVISKNWQWAGDALSNLATGLLHAVWALGGLAVGVYSAA